MAPVFKAGAPPLIWLIVGIFWVVSQLAGAAAKKNLPRKPVKPDSDSGEPPVDPFAELLRKLNNTQPFEVPQPAEFEELPEEPAEEPPAFVPRNAWRVGEIEKLPDIEPLRREVPAPEPAVQPQEIPVRPTMQAFRSTLPAMKLPAVSFSFQGLEKTGGKLPNIGKIIGPANRKSLRRAMLSHIVFSPPKALEP